MTRPSPKSIDLEHIARNLDHEPIPDMWTAYDEFKRLPPGAAICALMVATFAAIAIAIAIYAGSMLFSAAMDRAAHDTADMTCQTPAC